MSRMKPLNSYLARRVDCRDGQFDGKLAAVAMQPQQLDPRIQYIFLTRCQETLQAAEVRLAVLGRDDRFAQCPSDRFLARPAENLFRLTVPAGDDSCRIHLHHGIHRGFDGGAQARFIFAARLEHGGEPVGHFVEAVAHPAEFVVRVERDARIQVAVGKGARGAGKRPDAADNGVVHADRKINHYQKRQQSDAGAQVQRIFRLCDARLDEGFGGRQQGVVHLRIAPVDRRRGYIQVGIGRRGKTPAEDVGCDEVGDLARRIGDVSGHRHERFMHRRIMASCLIEVDVEELERIAEFGDHDTQIDLLLPGDLFPRQNAGAVCANPPEVFERMRQFVEGGVEQVIRGEFRIQRQPIFVGDRHLE